MVHDPSLLVDHLVQESGLSAKVCPSGDFSLNGLCVGYESLCYGKFSNKGYSTIYGQVYPKWGKGGQTWNTSRASKAALLLNKKNWAYVKREKLRLPT